MQAKPSARDNQQARLAAYQKATKAKPQAQQSAGKQIYPHLRSQFDQRSQTKEK